jgi:predicted small metal-binding protein
MAKAFRCADVGVSCSWEAVAETEEELLDKVFKHIMVEHKSCKITDAIRLKIRAFIREK